MMIKLSSLNTISSSAAITTCKQIGTQAPSKNVIVVGIAVIETRIVVVYGMTMVEVVID